MPDSGIFWHSARFAKYKNGGGDNIFIWHMLSYIVGQANS